MLRHTSDCQLGLQTRIVISVQKATVHCLLCSKHSALSSLLKPKCTLLLCWRHSARTFLLSLHSITQGNGVVPDLPLLGTAMPVIVYGPAQSTEGSLRAKLVLPAAGSWVKLRNVKSWAKAGQLQV